MNGVSASSPVPGPVRSTSHSRSATSSTSSRGASKISSNDLEKRRKVAEALKLPLIDVNGKKKE